MSQTVNGRLIVKGSRNAPTHGIQNGAEYIRMPGPTSDYLIHVQDGNGRVQHKWNATFGTREKFLRSNENAWLWDVGVITDPYMEFKYAPTKGNSGTNIAWRTHMAFRKNGYVGINTRNPGRHLHVNGMARANSYEENVREIDTATADSYNVVDWRDSIFLIRIGGKSSNFTMDLPNGSNGRSFKFKIIQDKGQGGKLFIKPANNQKIETMPNNQSYVLDTTIVGNLGCVQLTFGAGQWWFMNTV